MKMFIWQSIADLTNSHHSSGGAIVVAENLSEVLGLLNKERSRRREEWEDPIEPLTELPEPTAEYYVGPTRPQRVFIFPDAGCC